MLYAIIAEDNDNSLQKRLKSRDSHIKRLNELKNQAEKNKLLSVFLIGIWKMR